METVDLDELGRRAPEVVKLLDVYWEALRAQDWNENTALVMCTDLAALVWARVLGFEIAPALARTMQKPEE